MIIILWIYVLCLYPSLLSAMTVYVESKMSAK